MPIRRTNIAHPMASNARRSLCSLGAFVLLALPGIAGALSYRCPESYTDDDGRALTRIERPTGVWRVNDPVPFASGQGRFWRLVCSYQDPQAPGERLEAIAYWVTSPHEDGRLILEDTCRDDEPAPGTVSSERRQAKSRASEPTSAASWRLAREMLVAAESEAVPCPGSPEAPRVCPRWEVTEMYQNFDRVCQWKQDEAFRYIYRSECRFRGFLTAGRVQRLGEGTYERSYRNSEGEPIRFLYRGAFERGGVVQGYVHWVSADGDRSREVPFQARCIEDASQDSDEGRRAASPGTSATMKPPP